MTKPLVIVAKGEDPYDTARVALEKFPLPDLKGRNVLIKPNAARLALPGEGVTTHPLVIAAIIHFLKGRGAGDLVIGESCIYGVNPEEAFRLTGMKEISEKEGVELVNLDQRRPLEIPLPDGKLLRSIKVSMAIKDFDFVISVPVMKTHMHTGVTLSVKNMKGLLWRREKSRFHQLKSEEGVIKGDKELDIAISEMASVLFPHMAIIDGSMGMEGMGPAYGKTKKTGLVAVGLNALSVDAVAAALMGLTPEEVPHLRLSAEKGLGEIRLSKISVDPVDYLKWITPFDPPPADLSIVFPHFIVHDEGSCSACLATLLVFLQQHHSRLRKYRLEDGNVHIGIGKNLNNLPEGTILIGNCTSNMRRKGVFVQGCPPVSSQILSKLRRPF